MYNGTNWINSMLSSSNISDFLISSPGSNQVLQYNGSKWINNTLNLVTALSSLSDCSVSPSNDQILVYTTASSLNKWTNYTLSGATFNDSTKTITISAGSSALSSLTDVQISSASANQGLVYNGTKWANSQINHTTLSNIGTNTHAQIDTFLGQFNLSSISNGDILRYNLSTAKWFNSTTLTNDETNINNLLLAIPQNINLSNVTQNTATVASYADSTNGYSVYVYYPSVTLNTIASIVISPGSNSYISNSTTVVLHDGGDALYRRVNIKLGNVKSSIYSIVFGAITNTNYWPGNIYAYGSNNSTTYTDTSSTVSNATLLYSASAGILKGWSATASITDTNAYQYVHILITYDGTITGGTVQINRPAGYVGLASGTDYTISSDSTTGNPLITYINSTTDNLMYTYPSLCIEELHRRIYPVIRDKNTLVLTDGTNTATITSTSNIATGLKSATSTISISSATAPSAGQVLTATSSTSATWQTPTTGSSTLSSLTDCTISSPVNNQLLTYNGSKWVNSSSASVNALYLTNNGFSISMWANPLTSNSNYSVPPPGTTGQIMSLYNNSGSMTWIDQTISNCKDVLLTTPAEGDMMIYSNNKWTNASTSFVVGVVSSAFYDTNKIYTSSASIDAYVIDNDAITTSGYYFDVPADTPRHLQTFYIQTNNTYHGFNIVIRDSVNLMYVGAGLGAHFYSLDPNKTIILTYYTSNCPWNTGSFPCWVLQDTVLTTNIIPIPSTVNTILFDSCNVATPFSSNLQLNLINKRSVETVDIGGSMYYTPINLTANGRTFRPSNNTTYTCNLNTGLYKFYRFLNDYFSHNITNVQ